MSCLLGIYRERECSIDDRDVLICHHGEESPRDLLRVLAPFLQDFQAARSMADTGYLAAGLAWHLIDSGLDLTRGFPEVEIVSEIRSDIDFFIKVSPGYVDVYRVNEVLEWKPVATLEIHKSPLPMDILQD